jgi:hypothetical protein
MLHVTCFSSTAPRCASAAQGTASLYREMFGAKNGATAWTFFIVVTPRGRIVYVSDVDGASNTDGTQWKKSGCCEALVAKYGSDSKFIIGGDKGYVHASPPAGWQPRTDEDGRHERRARP